MPHTNRRSKKEAVLPQVHWVSVTLTDEDKARIKSVPNVFEGIDDTLVAMCHDGYKFKLSFDAFNDCYSCFVLPGDGSANAGWILTGRGSTPLKALKQALYIHSVVLEADWVDVNEPLRGAIDD